MGTVISTSRDLASLGASNSFRPTNPLPTGPSPKRVHVKNAPVRHFVYFDLCFETVVVTLASRNVLRAFRFGLVDFITAMPASMLPVPFCWGLHGMFNPFPDPGIVQFREVFFSHALSGAPERIAVFPSVPHRGSPSTARPVYEASWPQAAGCVLPIHVLNGLVGSW